MEDDEDMTPFWLQTTDNRRHRRRVQPSSFFFNTGVLIILLLVVAFAFIFVIIPSFLSFTSQIFKPQLVKKSWDSLNLVLVLFAIICGFLSKNNSNNDNDSRSGYEDYKFSSTPKHVRSSSNPSTPREWYGYSSASDRPAYSSLQRLRSSSSYPDLRQESSWVMNAPPPPPALEARASKRESQKPPVTTHKPPLPVKIRNIKGAEESVESGNESPLNPIPPPPPPPPFKMPPLKFEVHGDYVRLKSIRSGSPDFDDPLSGEGSPSDGNGNSTGGPLFCPSPDVDTKADNFIARFRAGLKLEKLNSVKGRSNLGLDPGPSTV
ncbi:hypothetical protein COLO4_30709 [Corchorus olitorius]|uniref:Hydroxyproline-rich glycoprotein family protein n=1 Tax=Corchorus olitorius TaxID=93759 RepID=A0A1R3H743_9ROSI|nr:hypothetical protein COLO4_30709 [Corchorus olitorius]